MKQFGRRPAQKSANQTSNLLNFTEVHLCPGLHAAAKIGDDNVHFSRVHDHLKHSRFPILPNLLYVRKISALLAILAFPCQRN